MPLNKRPDDISDKLFSLREAILSKSYPRLYKELRRFPGMLSPEAALPLLKWSLEQGLTRRAFESILEHSPPVPEILSDANQRKIRFGLLVLIEDAALHDRADVLSLFLERGASPNKSLRSIYSPLEAALVESLLRQSGGLLATEDPGELIYYALHDGIPRTNRAAVLAFVHKETGYDL